MDRDVSMPHVLCLMSQDKDRANFHLSTVDVPLAHFTLISHFQSKDDKPFASVL